jgi:hypothetical protein
MLCAAAVVLLGVGIWLTVGGGWVYPAVLITPRVEEVPRPGQEDCHKGAIRMDEKPLVRIDPHEWCGTAEPYP